MNDYQPTDEQIEALARDDYAQWGGNDGLLGDDFDSWVTEARAVVGYPAFQSIIRAAQAEAWDEGNQFVVDTCDAIWVNEWALGDNPHREAADV